MPSRHSWIIIAIVLILAFGVFQAGAQHRATEGSNPPDHPPGPPPAAMCTDGQYLYVQHGPMIYQFSTTGLILKKKIQLPRPEPPPGQQINKKEQ